MVESALNKRILVVDNDPRTRKSVKELLELDYIVEAAEGNYDELLRDVHRRLSSTHFHLAILDLRLANDNDPNDSSGLDLAAEIRKRYPWVHSIFLTGYTDFRVVQRALDQGLGLSLMLKEDGPSVLRDKVNEVFSRLGCAWDQRLQWRSEKEQAGAFALLERLDWNGQSSLAWLPEELTQVLGCLFPKADELHLRPLTDYSSSLSITPGNSLLLRISAHEGTRFLNDVAVKIGRREAIEREVANYERYVKNQIGAYRYAAQQARALTPHLGGIVYALFDVDVDHWKTFREHYLARETRSSGEVSRILEQLFDHLLLPWSADSSQAHENLWQEYSAALELEKRLSRLRWGNDDELSLPGFNRPLPNPVKWLERYAIHSDMRTNRHTIHGDLHSRNIFVSAEDTVWLIDFERTGPGHALCDFVELETDIKFGLTALSESDEELYGFLECALLTHDRDAWKRGGVRAPERIRTHPELRRAFNTIAELRRLAANHSPYPDFRDYYWGLLFQALFVATLNPLSAEARQRAQLSAALICDRLGDGQRVPANWSARGLLTTPRRHTRRRKSHSRV